MSELQFPKDPIVGQEYDFPPYKYYWDGIKWKTKGISYIPLNDLRAELSNLLSGGSKSSLPTPPAKAAINTAVITATVPYGVTTGWNGKFCYTYYHWDVRKVIPNCRFGITDSASWSKNSVMALRNDATGTTVWTKAYSTLGITQPQGACFDLTGGFFYVFVGAGVELRLWRIKLSDGTSTLIATDAGVKCLTYTYGASVPMGVVARFISPAIIEYVYYNYGAPDICYRTTVNVSTGIFTAATQFNAVGYNAGEFWDSGSASYGTNAAAPTMNASVQYVTRDGKISVSFTPSQLTDVPKAGTSTNGGDRGSIRTYMITRGLGRCVLSVTDPAYHTPYRHDSFNDLQNQVFVTSNDGAIAMITEKTQYVPGWDGRFDFYDAADFDRWLTEIADKAGLPEGGWW